MYDALGWFRWNLWEKSLIITGRLTGEVDLTGPVDWLGWLIWRAEEDSLGDGR